jgi:hypothetical protein
MRVSSSKPTHRKTPELIVCVSPGILSVRELISRNLMRLQAEGLLDVDARQIVVKDLKGLNALLESTP